MEGDRKKIVQLLGTDPPGIHTFRYNQIVYQRIIIFLIRR